MNPESVTVLAAITAPTALLVASFGAAGIVALTRGRRGVLELVPMLAGSLACVVAFAVMYIVEPFSLLTAPVIVLSALVATSLALRWTRGR